MIIKMRTSCDITKSVGEDTYCYVYLLWTMDWSRCVLLKKQLFAIDQFKKMEMIVNVSKDSWWKKCGKLTEKLSLQELILQQTANLALLPAAINLLLNLLWPFLVQHLLLFWSLRDEDAYVHLQRQLIQILSCLPFLFMKLKASRRFIRDSFWCCTWCGLLD